MKNLLTDVKCDRFGLILTVAVKYRGWERDVRVQVPWKYLAGDDVMGHLQRERNRRHRSWDDENRPYLPLEKWE